MGNMTRRRRAKPPSDSVPTYIRFSKDQLKLMDEAINKGNYLNRSEIARAAIRLLFNIGRTDHTQGEQSPAPLR